MKILIEKFSVYIWIQLKKNIIIDTTKMDSFFFFFQNKNFFKKITTPYVLKFAKYQIKMKLSELIHQ